MRFLKELNSQAKTFILKGVIYVKYFDAHMCSRHDLNTIFVLCLQGLTGTTGPRGEIGEPGEKVLIAFINSSL